MKRRSAQYPLELFLVLVCQWCAYDGAMGMCQCCHQHERIFLGGSVGFAPRGRTREYTVIDAFCYTTGTIWHMQLRLVVVRHDVSSQGNVYVVR